MRVSSWLGLTSCVVMLFAATASAQQSAGTRYNEVTVAAQATGEELSAQPATGCGAIPGLTPVVALLALVRARRRR